MIFATSFDHFFSSVIKTVLDNSEHKQFIFSLDYRTNLFTEEGDEIHIPSPDIYFLIDGRTNYIGVWEVVIYPNVPAGTGVRSIREVKADEWVNKSNHDSCWRSEGMQSLFKLWCECVEKLAAKVEKKKLDIPRWKIADAVSISTGLTFCQKVSFEKERAQDNQWKYVIKDLKFL